jgi:hypothetical protein
MAGGVGHDDFIPQNVSLEILEQALEPLSQDPIHVNVYYKKPDRVVVDTVTGEQTTVESNPPTWRDRVETFPTRDAFDSWVELQSKTMVGQKGAIGITNYSWHGRRLEKSFAFTNRGFLDCDSGGTYEKIATMLSSLGVRFSVHESSGSVRRRTLGATPVDSLPSKWHLGLAFSQALTNPLDEVYPQGETELQAKQREAAMSSDDLAKERTRAGYLRREWKRKQHFLIRFFSTLAGLDANDGAPGFDLTVAQMCQFRYLGVKYTQDGPDPIVWNSRGQFAINFDRLLQVAGYVPAEYKPWQPRNKAVVKVARGDGTGRVDVYKKSGGYEDLDTEIQRSLTMDRFIGDFAGIQPDTHNGGGSKSWTCPVPTHPDPGRRTLETDRSKSWDGDWFRCWGDCDCEGGVIKFASLFWGISYRQARLDLAKHLGLNPADYRGRLEKVGVEFEETTDQTVRIPLGGSSAKKLLAKSKAKKLKKAEAKAEAEKLAGVQAEQEFEAEQRRKDKAFAKKALPCTAAWVAENMASFKDRDSFFLAMIKMILLAQRKVKDVEAIASTLWPSFGDLYGNDKSALLFEVVGTYERLLAGSPAIGSGFIKEHVKSWERLKLAEALALDGYAFRPMLKSLVGFGLTVGDDRDYLNDQWSEHDVDSGRTPNLHDPESPEFKKHEKRRVPFKNAFRRPGVCCLCDQIMVGSGNRNLGPTGPDGEASELKRKIVCNTKICLFCAVLQTISEAELLDDMWADEVSEKKPCFIVKGTVEKMAWIKAVKKDLGYVSDAKLAIVGWGSNYKPELTVLVRNEAAAISVRSAIQAAQIEAAKAEGSPLTAYPVVGYERVTEASRTVDIAACARISFNIHGKRLIEEQRSDELAEWLWWSIGKVPVRNPQKADALHWPTNAMVQAQCKKDKGEDVWEPELWPGEVATYILKHRKTGYVLARRKKVPFGIDDAHKHMKNNSGFRYAQSQLEAAEAKAAGRVVFNATTHRVTLGGAAARSA